MSFSVSDARSNPNDQIAHAAQVIGSGKQRAAVFRAIHTGKKKAKTVSEIAAATQLSRKRVLEEGVKLVKQHIVQQTKEEGEIAYVRDAFFSAKRDKILRLAGSKKALGAFPTKYNQNRGSTKQAVIRLPQKWIDTESITIDQIESFRKARGVAFPSKRLALPERRFKQGLQGILGDRGTFTDWGGEQNDFFSSKLILTIGGKRLKAAFGLKGPGTKGKLTPKKMGKNGNQIQRLFRSPADVFVVQYLDDIDEDVIEQMQEFAKAKSVSEGRKIWYGVIDGTDSDRLAISYPKEFRKKK